MLVTIVYKCSLPQPLIVAISDYSPLLYELLEHKGLILWSCLLLLLILDQ